MKSKIFGLGLSRTGTTSLNNFLIELGYNVIHYPTPEQLFDFNNDGATDIPVIPVYKQLDQRFPNSKFILTIRDKQQWLESIIPYLERKRNWNQGSRQVSAREAVYGVAFPNKEQASMAWDKHHYDVEEYFHNRKNDIITINIINGESTERLLNFLGKQSTITKYPHDNILKRK